MDQEPKHNERSFIRELVPDWRPTRKQLVWTVRIVIGIVFLLGILTLIGLPFNITLWAWVKLLIVPTVIAAGGIWFNRQQRERELEIAERRTQDEALQAYLDQMSSMLIPNKDQPSLYKARPGDSLSSVARARTLTVLARLDGDRKARVVQFLYESGLIAKNGSVVDLSKADLRGAVLSRIGLYSANLSGADLREADLHDANLNSADLREANLRGANLRGAFVGGVELSSADLRETNLNMTYMHGTDLNGTDLRGANLKGANLGGANLSSAGLTDTELSDADLSGANLFGAYVRVDRGTDTTATGVLVRSTWPIANEELSQQGTILDDATMPNGQKYEDWIKSRQGQGG